MKNIKNILGTGVFMLLSSWAVSSCTEKSDWDIDSSYNRPFGTDENGISVEADSKVARAVVTWSPTQNTDYYIIEISPNEMTDETPMGSEENGNIVYGNDPANRIKQPPYTMENLNVNTTYYLRIKSISGEKESLWVNYKKTFESVKEEAILNTPSAEDLPEGQGKVRMSWEAGLTVDHFEITETGTTESILRNISAEEITAGEAWIENLKTFSEYTIGIYNGNALRGSQTITIPGLEIESEISNVTDNSAVFSWETTVDVDEYACVLSSEGVPESGIKLSQEEISAHQVNITGLTSSTEYTAYAFVNGAICSRITFTTQKGKPAGYREMTWEEALADWDNLTGKILINVSGTETFAQEEESIPSGITHLIFWGDNKEEQVNMTIKKGIGASGICEKVEFHNLNITDEGNTTLIYQNNSSGCIKKIEVTSCTITDIRGIVRMNASTTDAMAVTIDDCIIKGLGRAATSNHYGLLLSDKVILTSIDLMVSNTSVITAKGAKSSQFIRHKSGQNSTVTIKDCTFYDMSASDAIFRDTDDSAIIISNVLFAKGGISPFYKKAPSSLVVNGLYKASDFTFNTSDWGKDYTVLSLTSDQLFPNGANEDLTFGTDVSEENRVGDPRWNK
jgi:hypothetical protein